MLTVAYLANQFPCAVEPYVGEEIEELRGRGLRVIAGSVRAAGVGAVGCAPEIVLRPVRVSVMLRALGLSLRRWTRISPLIGRAVFGGREGPFRRAKALLHTWLGSCYAVQLQESGVDHIHAHHGYYGSWIAMAAARLLDVGFSMTLHGSDLLVHGVYLDTKLKNCAFCLTVSEYNRRYILERYPSVQAGRVVVSRLGVSVGERVDASLPRREIRSTHFALLSVGRLHAVKDHAFLVRACAQLQEYGVSFECSIAGDGPERRRLESLIRKRGLGEKVILLGHVARRQMDSLYDRADVVVLTSRSEGIPLVLMEAMARGKIVLAPAITGIPELVLAGKTGFLYEAGSLQDFVSRLHFIRSLLVGSGKKMPERSGPNPAMPSATRQLDWVRHAAQVQVRHNFNRRKNLESFGDLFVRRIAAQTGDLAHENSVLQQIQLSVQRHRSLPV